MNNLAGFSVCLWFLPVTLFIVIPLTLAIVWHIGMLVNVLRKPKGS